MHNHDDLRRVIYTSRARAGGDARDLADILAQSRLNNGLDGLSGLLWATDGRYVQVLEGSIDAMDAALHRILRDPRHTDVAIVSDTRERDRAFGDWTMANLPDEPAEAMQARLALLLATAPSAVKDAFAR